MTKDQTPAHNTITVEKFAKRVAAAVYRFLDVSPLCLGIYCSHGSFDHANVPIAVQEVERLDGQDANWRVGAGGITKGQVILIGVVHISQGSWQPILQLNRYVVPRCQHIPGLP
jgi:hypothetical protein